MPSSRKKTNAATHTEETNVPVESESKPNSKSAAREKKEKKIKVIAVVTPEGIEGSFTPEPRKPLICHLPFDSKEVKFNDHILVNEIPPNREIDPYVETTEQYFGIVADGTEEQESSTYAYSDSWNQDHKEDEKKVTENAMTSMNVQWKSIGENFDRCDLMTYYKKGESFVLPESTPIACYWCSHTFDNRPCFIPMREEKGAFHIYGNFCTPQCSLAYLLKEVLDPHVRWERMALLHRLYRPHAGGRIYPAPPRESLARFGGPYSYDEFRGIIGENKTRVDIQMPPMVSILGSLDTKPIDFYDSSLQNTFTQGLLGIQERFAKPNDGTLRLKRNKPLKDKESTLDACIQISFKSSGVAAH